MKEKKGWSNFRKNTRGGREIFEQPVIAESLGSDSVSGQYSPELHRDGGIRRRVGSNQTFSIWSPEYLFSRENDHIS